MTKLTDQIAEQHPTDYRAFRQAFHQENGRRISANLAFKVERGLPNAALPLGYRFDRTEPQYSGQAIGNDTGIVIDEPAASLVQKAFELADKKGYSTRKIISILTEKGLRSRHGKVLGPSSMWKILTNPFYCGLVRFRGRLLPGKHQPLVSKERFERVQT